MMSTKALATSLAGVGLVLAGFAGGSSEASASMRSQQPGIARIPGMTRVSSSGVGRSACSGWTGTSRPHWCSALKLRHGRYEGWILTVALRQDGYRNSVPAGFARAHPGPVVVTGEWLTLASARQAEQLLHEPDFNKSYAGSAAPAVNGGVARRFIDPASLRSQDEFEFFWASGSTVVNVNVIGANLTVAAAQRIARLARPR